MARWRDDFCAAYGFVVAEDTPPIDAAAFLKSRVARIPATLRPILSGLQNYPAYLHTQLAKQFPRVHRSDLDRTVDKLLDCHAKCAHPLHALDC